MSLWSKISEWYNGKEVITEYDNEDQSVIILPSIHTDYHWTAKCARATVKLCFSHWQWIIMFVLAVIGLVFNYPTFHQFIHPKPAAETTRPQKETETNKFNNSQTIVQKTSPPPKIISQPETQQVKSEQKQQINAPNSAISINQSGGVTAHTINIQQDRRITPEQQIIIINRLKELPKDVIEISYSSGSPEQSKFAESLIAPLKTAGFDLMDTSGLFQLTPYGGGLSVITNDKPPYPKGATALQKAFTEAKIEAKWYGIPEFKRDKIWICIGER